MKILFVQTNYPGFLDDFYKRHPGHNKYSYRRLKNEWAKEMFGSSNFYSNHFKKLGWKAEDVVANDIHQQEKWAEENSVEIRFRNNNLFMKLPAVVRHHFDGNSWIKKTLFAQIDKFKPDVAYFHDLWLLNKRDIEFLKKKEILVVGQIASPIPPFHETLRGYDLVITSLPNFIKKFMIIGVNTEYLRWCFERSAAKKVGRKKRIYNTVFVGSFTHLHTKGGKYVSLCDKKGESGFMGLWEA